MSDNDDPSTRPAGANKIPEPPEVFRIDPAASVTPLPEREFTRSSEDKVRTPGFHPIAEMRDLFRRLNPFRSPWSDQKGSTDDDYRHLSEFFEKSIGTPGQFDRGKLNADKGLHIRVPVEHQQPEIPLRPTTPLAHLSDEWRDALEEWIGESLQADDPETRAEAGSEVQPPTITPEFHGGVVFEGPDSPTTGGIADTLRGNRVAKRNSFGYPEAELAMLRATDAESTRQRLLQDLTAESVSVFPSFEGDSPDSDALRIWVGRFRQVPLDNGGVGLEEIGLQGGEPGANPPGRQQTPGEGLV